MTVTIDIAPDIEAHLQAQASQSGVDVPGYVRRLVESSVRRPRLRAAAERAAAVLAALDSFMGQDEQEHRDTLAPPCAAGEQERIAATHAARGSMAHVGVAVDDLHRERQADKKSEEQEALKRLP